MEATGCVSLTGQFVSDESKHILVPASRSASAPATVEQARTIAPVASQMHAQEACAGADIHIEPVNTVNAITVFKRDLFIVEPSLGGRRSQQSTIVLDHASVAEMYLNVIPVFPIDERGTRPDWSTPANQGPASHPAETRIARISSRFYIDRSHKQS